MVTWVQGGRAFRHTVYSRLCTVGCVVPFSDRKEPGNEARLACRSIVRTSTLSQDFARETFVLHAKEKLG